MRPTSSRPPWPCRLQAATLFRRQYKSHRLMLPERGRQCQDRVQTIAQRSEMSTLVYPLMSLLVEFKFFVEAIHQVHIYKNENHEYIDRPLLCKPKTEFKASKPELIQPVHEQDTCSV